MERLNYKILFELDDNARQSYSKIAEKIKTSKQVVSNHVSKLIEEEYLKKFLTVLDLSKLGLTLHKLYLRLIRTTQKDEEKIINFLKGHKCVSWLVQTEGTYDIALALHTRDISELNKVLTEIETKFGNFISEKIINRVLTGEFFHRDYLLEDKKSDLRKNVVFQTQESPHKVDNTDLKILAGLCRDSKKSVLEISEKVKISADAVSKRIKNLERLGIIKNYITVLNTEKMNLIHYKVLLRIGSFNQETEKDFLMFCKGHKNITFYNKGIGSWEIEIDLEVEKSEKFREIMRDLKNQFADKIKEYFPLMIYDIHKFDFLPMYDF